MNGKENRKIAVGIVTYNPDKERLERNIHLLQENECLGRIYVADNTSDNLGVATALNQLCRKALADGYEWLLTLDQDSQPEPHLIDCLAQHIAHIQPQATAIICPRIEDVNMGRMYSPRAHGCEYIKSCITAGSMLSLTCWQQVDGFDDGLFIDGVDFDFCLRLRQGGYKILRVYDTALHQEIGKGKAINLGSHRLAIMNHPPERMYYITRNYLAIGKRYHRQAYWGLEVLKRLFIILVFEKQKLRKLAYFFRGIRDYRQGKTGALPQT